MTTLFASLYNETEINEGKMTELKHKDVHSEMIGEIGKILPDAKKVLIDERDIFFSEMIKATTGQHLVAVGAGRVAVIQKQFSIDNRGILADITTIPPFAKGWKIAGWVFPLLIIGSIITIGLQRGEADTGGSLLF